MASTNNKRKRRHYFSHLKGVHYEEIVQAFKKGQLWLPSGHFYPDCSA